MPAFFFLSGYRLGGARRSSRGPVMVAAQPVPSPSRIEAEVQRARGLAKLGRFAEALSIAHALLGEVPENRDVLYLVAVSQRYLGRVADALRTLARFEAVHPDYGRLYQEFGHCYRAVGEADAAIKAYEQALARNHTLSASWSALRELYVARGRRVAADNAAAQVATLAKLPAEVVHATNLFRRVSCTLRSSSCAGSCRRTATTSKRCACWPRLASS